MADVIGLKCPPIEIKPKFSNHLLENNILDEPLYENGEIIKKIFQANNKLSKSLMRIHEENLSSSKEENIYENVTYRENKLNSINELKNLKPILKNEVNHIEGTADQQSKNSFNIQSIGADKDDSPVNKGLYTSTFSLTIGKPMTPSIVEISEEKELNINVNDGSNSPQEERSIGSSGSTFKSSYAKSLLDSFRKNDPTSQSAIINQNSLLKPVPAKREIKPSSPSPSSENELNSVQITPVAITPLISSECPNKSIERLENRVSSLTDNILLKDKELEKLRQEVMFLKLECNRVKAENRSLKASLNSGLSSRTYLANGDSHPHSPVSSISADSDTWTLQQQIASLNAQLEKAELSRHAYEAATKQLVHFLQTINSTLTTVGGSDSKLQSPFTSQNTSELLSNLESTLLENRGRTVPPKIKTNPYFESPRDGSYLSKGDIHPPTNLERQLHVRNETSVIHESKGKETSSRGVDNHDNREVVHSQGRGLGSDHQYIVTAGKSRSPHSSLISSSINEETESVVYIKEAVVHKIKMPADAKEDKKRTSPQRRFSISQKLFNSTKRPLVRSGSVNNLPTELTPVPRVSRAVSTHCVAIDKVEQQPETADDNAGQSSANSKGIKSSKAKDFFSSLKNLFKPDERSSQDMSKKKSPAQSTQRSNKVKNDTAPLSLHLHAPSSASTNLKKRHSMKTVGVPRVPPLNEMEALPSPNSTFYVPCHSDSEDRLTGSDQADITTTSEESIPTSDTTVEADVEISGPQELSLSLRKESAEETNPSESPTKGSPSSSGAPFNCSVTGGGICTGTGTEWSDGLRPGLLNGDGNAGIMPYRRVSQIKSLEVENFNLSKKKLPRVASCREGDMPGLNRRISNKASHAIRRRRSDFDAIGLKFSLWKLSRESYRAKECRVAFV